LNVIWKAGKRKYKSIVWVAINRLFTFLSLLVVGLLLLISHLASALVSGFAGRLDDVLPAADLLLQVANFLVFFGIIVLLVAFLFKVLPTAPLRWRDVWLGSGVTALLFSIGKLGIGFYLGFSSASSSFGAAGAFAVLLIWVYYSAQILLTGAVFTQIYVTRRRSRTETADDAGATSGSADVSGPSGGPDAERDAGPDSGPNARHNTGHAR
jgi:membrane protein